MGKAITHVGYIGLGIMGKPMAGHLLASGLQLSVWNRTRSKAAELDSAGALVLDSPAAMAAARPRGNLSERDRHPGCRGGAVR